ncbi:hypothetical protein [Halarcobacter bivalviorum]|uniref:Highly acidic protein n=1 Tax=Halarcobacter bivalviorum TaxID=663364 RepID=A0AAX2A5Y7_9BACT|nr:hypothetical protein [Halarcobacter bivalviorum]AXH11631.1 hypothetical protein ABIV_0618 [Halarcobacter bivalviorum]RXK08956.1 hypothetical protein CRV05_13010 [Halarcobacter bivalviorum]
MDLILITKTPIIEKIFKLVCKKLDLEVIIKDSTSFEKEEVYDLIIVDEEFINDDFNSLKRHTKKLAAITSEELPFEKSRDFIINRPFLPTTLEELLSEQIEYIKEDDTTKQDIKNAANEEEVVANYVESLADDIAYNIEEENDESIVSIASLNQGGILDNSELSKISDILHDEEIEREVLVTENDWKDINEIIDDALSEVSEYEFNLDNSDDKEQPIKVLLNNYSIEELKPFLQKFNQNVIDRLSNGEDIDVRLSLKVDN